MANITKAALEQQVQDMAAQIDALEARLAVASELYEVAQTVLGGTQYELERHATLLAQTTRQRDEAEAQLAAYNTPTHRITNAGYVAPAWQAERAAQLAAARELAMRLGRVVRVASC